MILRNVLSQFFIVKIHLVLDILAKDIVNLSYSLNTQFDQALNHLRVLTLKLHGPLLLGSLRYYAFPRSMATAAQYGCYFTLCKAILVDLEFQCNYSNLLVNHINLLQAKSPENKFLRMVSMNSERERKICHPLFLFSMKCEMRQFHTMH